MKDRKAWRAKHRAISRALSDLGISCRKRAAALGLRKGVIDFPAAQASTYTTLAKAFGVQLTAMFAIFDSAWESFEIRLPPVSVMPLRARAVTYSACAHPDDPKAAGKLLVAIVGESAAREWASGIVAAANAAENERTKVAKRERRASAGEDAAARDAREIAAARKATLARKAAAEGRASGSPLRWEDWGPMGR